MQVTELAADGLKREYKVVVGAGEIEDRVTKRLAELQQKVRMPGFRPGKVPVTLLRKQYGRSLMGEVIEQVVGQGSQQAIADHELRPALQPKVEITSFEDGSDLEFTMAVEVLPQVPKVEVEAIELTRLTSEVTEEAQAEALQNFAKRLQDYQAPAAPRPAQSGDRLVIDFEGRIDGELFEGGKGEKVPVVLGSGFLVAGFEDQLVGAERGAELTVDVTFPEAYPNATVAGKAASFAVTVHEVAEPLPIELNDELAKGQGFDDLSALQTTIREAMEREYANVSRARIKRQLLDHLAENVRFEVPPGMVEMEFEAIWKQLSEELERTGETAEKSEDELKAEYRAIAERRVRLGLILSDIGQTNELKVEQHEINNAIMDQARRHPGQEQKVFELFRSNPQALEQLRAPLYEDKVVDFILQLARVTEKAVTTDELMRDPEDDGEAAAETATASS